MSFLVNLARVVFAPLLEPLMATFQVGPGAAGVVATLAWLGSALPRVPTGYALTRVSRQRVIVGAGGLLAVSAAGAAVAPTFGLLAVGAFLMGASSGAYFIAANPLLSELYPDRIGRALGTHLTAGQLAAVAAAPLVGAVLAFDGLRAVFWLISLGALAATVALYRVARRADLPRAGHADRDLLGAIRAQGRLILFGIFVAVAAAFAWNGVFNFYVTYLKAAKALSEPAARDLLTVAFAAGVPAFWLSGRLADRLPRIPFLAGVQFGFTGCLVALTVVDGFLALAVVSAAIGYVIHGLFPVLDAYLLDAFPNEHRASAYAAYSGTSMLIQSMAGSVIGALLAAGAGYDAIFRGLAVGPAVAAVLLLALWSLGRLPGQTA